MNENNEKWQKATRVTKKIEKEPSPDIVHIAELKKSIHDYELGLFVFLAIAIFSVVLHFSFPYAPKLVTVLFGTLFLLGFFGSLLTWFAGNTSRRVIERQQLLMAGAEDISSLNPVQFEKYCGILLNDNGWRVEYTAITGDYGADIIATKNGVKMVVQCKHYTGNVGVSAVQEVFSAMSYYHAQKACVVASRGGFTKAAKSLALRTGVKVMCPSELK